MDLFLVRASGPRLAFLMAMAACQAAPPEAPPPSPSAWFEPARDLGVLFHDVQLAGIFDDSKTFVDARLRASPQEIVARYDSARTAPEFDMLAFVRAYFELPAPERSVPQDILMAKMEERIQALWPTLTRPPDSVVPYTSLIPLPYPYVVPGGRFREVYYWDSYFTMLGLVASGRTDLVKSMLDNFADLVRRIGHIPNANRTYYLSRSQPPFFAAMVGLYASVADTQLALVYLDVLESEYAFWMDGGDTLVPGQSHRRVVRLADGTLLNRYWDDRAEPRPESYREDFALGTTLPDTARGAFYRNVRAAAESGWDFSSRWMRDPFDLRTLETTDLVAVDLNSLLYHAERTIAALRAFRSRAGDREAAARFARAASARAAALRRAAYDPDSGFFYDVRWRDGARVTARPTLAAVAPLYFGVATGGQASAVADRLRRQFLRPGGFVTTLVVNGQQWDAPNGWAPLQWLAVQGLCRYGHAALADSARERWLALVRRTFQSTGKMMEKYDVVDVQRRAGGGEYPTQDGFGWTNGVTLAFTAQERSDSAGETLSPPLACTADGR